MEKSSKFRDFIQFLASVRGDLANITAPPFLIAPQSVVEVCSAWTERPSIFAAIAKESTPERRALMVLRWLLASAKAQFYIAGAPGTGIKKPLNAILGELYMGSWTDGAATLQLVAEQVSHHPPITAVHMWDEKNGIRADGYTRIGMTFSGSLDIRQTGHTLIHIDGLDEDYITPVFHGSVRGFLSSKLYPEAFGTYHIVSSTGIVSEIRFSGSGLFWGDRNSVQATVYREDDPLKTPIYELSGQWSEKFTITDAVTKEILEVYDTNNPVDPKSPASMPDVDDQDPWESRRLWKDVLIAVEKGRFGDLVTEKTKIEKVQREMRTSEAKAGLAWQPLLFSPLEGDYNIFDKLGSATGLKLQKEVTKGVWRVNLPKLKSLQRPFRGDLTPLSGYTH